jgi:hypothetical protein
MKDLAGYTRDFLAAAIALYLLFGGDLTEEQVAGILLVASTAIALGTHLYRRREP